MDLPHFHPPFYPDAFYPPERGKNGVNKVRVASCGRCIFSAPVRGPLGTTGFSIGRRSARTTCWPSTRPQALCANQIVARGDLRYERRPREAGGWLRERGGQGEKVNGRSQLQTIYNFCRICIVQKVESSHGLSMWRILLFLGTEGRQQ